MDKRKRSILSEHFSDITIITARAYRLTYGCLNLSIKTWLC